MGIHPHLINNNTLPSPCKVVESEVTSIKCIYHHPSYERQALYVTKVLNTA